jgi:hypothetical protein
MEIEMTNETNQTNEANLPSYIVWHVIGEGKNERWIRIGAAWTNKDGKGLNLTLDALPHSGRTVLRVFTPKEQREDDLIDQDNQA